MRTGVATTAGVRMAWGSVQTFTDEDEEQSHGNEAIQRTDVNVSVLVPVEDSPAAGWPELAASMRLPCE
jgi:hypothetical protein